MAEPLQLQLWAMASLLPATDDVTLIVFADAQMGIDELRSRIVAARFELDCLKRENLELRRLIEEASQ